jgi:predicted PurR-regulated permease PerM
MSDSTAPANNAADVGHRRRAAQPSGGDEGPIAQAEHLAAQQRSADHRLGQRGQRFNRNSPFFVGLAASAGVAVTYGAVRALAAMAPVLLLIGVAMFFALGLEPAVSTLVNRRIPRWLAVTAVVACVIGIIGGAVAAAIPVVVTQAQQFSAQLPHYIQMASDHSSSIGRFNERFHLQQRITETISGSGRLTIAGIVKTGTEVFGVLSHIGVVLVMMVYFLADMPRIRASFYRCLPNSRRPRAILIGDEIAAKLGDYLLGNVVTSLIAGAATFVWCQAFGIPYAVLLGVAVAILDLFPYGSSIGGFIVAAVTLTVSIPVCIATVAFYIVFRLGEDYLLTPKIIGRALKIPAGVTLVAVLLGAAWLGVIGALVAIPIAAIVQLLVSELILPLLDEA